MYLQIKKLVLWPRDPQFKPRILPFEVGMVNVISGASKTGKSSVIPIIDYCLGSDRCAVPARTIRKACCWFGVVIQTAEGEKLLARREPDGQLSTGDMYLLEGDSIEIPSDAPQKNATVDAVKRMLDRLSGLTNLSFDSGENSGGFKARPSFRDLLAFSFQPQNIVANPDILFYKADTTEHREKLKTIFPYVLGATTPELLAKQWELESLLKELKRKEREQSAQASASQAWRAGLVNWISEADDLGLIVEGERNFKEYGEDKLISLLDTVVHRTSRDSLPSVASFEGASEEYTRLIKDESDVSVEVSVARRRLYQVNSLKEGISGYSQGLKTQRDRLFLSRWLRESAVSAGRQRCPICMGNMDESHKELDQLCDALSVVESSKVQVQPAPAAFDRELVEVKEQLRISSDKLNAIRILRRGHEERSKVINDSRLKSGQIDRFLGRAEQALKLFSERAANPELDAEILKLRENVADLRRQLSESARQKKIEVALRKISNLMGQAVAGLDAEQPEDPVRLDIKDLTIRVGGESDRDDYLWEMGSGANWLSYHISATIALQNFFLGQDESSVPNFLVYDQPSQVYFPRRLASSSDDDSEVVDDVKIRDEDIDAIRRFFDAFGKTVVKSEGRLQILVLDHAGSEVWGNLEGVTLVEEWRGKEKLVPMEWLRGLAINGAS